MTEQSEVDRLKRLLALAERQIAITLELDSIEENIATVTKQLEQLKQESLNLTGERHQLLESLLPGKGAR